MLLPITLLLEVLHKEATSDCPTRRDREGSLLSAAQLRHQIIEDVQAASLTSPRYVKYALDKSGEGRWVEEI
jgi:hypothetical protein